LGTKIEKFDVLSLFLPLKFGKKMIFPFTCQEDKDVLCLMLHETVAILFGCHADNALEIAVEGCGFGKACSSVREQTGA
jgi:hypothetical protein